MEVRKLNSLRALAVLIVLVSHYSNESGLWGGALGSGSGKFGVMIFFLLSAFLMAHLYLETPPTPCAMKNYALARIARVMPLFLVVVVACFAAQQSKSEILGKLAYNIKSTPSLISHLLLLSGESVLWTIPPEVHFYAIFAIAWFLFPRFGKGVLFVSVLVLLAYSAGIWPPNPSTIILGLPATLEIVNTMPYFIMGSLLGYGFHHWKPPTWLCSHGFIACLLAIPLLYPRIFLAVTGHSNGGLEDPRILFCISLIFFATVFLVPPGNPFLENRIGDKVGEISYSLYLLHQPLLVALKNTGLAKGIFGLALFLLLSFGLAWISFSAIETPMRRKIRALRKVDNTLESAPVRPR